MYLKNKKLVIISPYTNEPSEIDIEHTIEECDKTKLVIDHEFIIVPVEWYGAHNWYERVSNDILSKLVGLLNRNDIDLEEMKQEITKLVQKFFNRVDTTCDIPERIST